MSARAQDRKGPQGPTPGPWRVERQNPSPTTGEWMIAGGIPGYLAEVRDCGSGDVEANARLIAAAPDLLRALIDMLDAYEVPAISSLRRPRDNCFRPRAALSTQSLSPFTTLSGSPG